MEAAAIFVIPSDLPSMNKIIEASKMNYHAYRRLKNYHTNRVAKYVLQAKIPAMSRIDIKVTWICESRRQDKDNVSAGIKFILDGLQTAKVIEKDSWKFIGNIEHDFQVDRNNPRIIVELMEATGNE